MKTLNQYEARFKPGSKSAPYLRELMLIAPLKELNSYLTEVLVRLQRGGDVELARQILAVQAPIANRLGVHQLKKELEDAAFAIAHPAEYELTKRLLRQNKADKQQDLHKFECKLTLALNQQGIIPKQISSRTKQPYSLYKKLRKTGSITGVHDLLALRLVVGDEEECYRALDILHSECEPVVVRFKDYIKQPKSNGYQSLHTTVVADGRTVEVQIRTTKMDEQAEGGAAAHWQYDEHKHTKNYHRGIAATTNITTREYTYVFSPNGDVYRLPGEATALDFAFGVHTSIGLRMQGARINGDIKPIRTQLNQGDVVEILTGKTARPKRDWLQVVKSSKARHRIQTWLRQAERDRYLELGKELLSNAFDGQFPKNLNAVLPEYRLENIDDLFVAIGAGYVKPGSIVTKLTPDTPKRKPKSLDNALNTETPAVVISGMTDLEYRFGKCCNPRPPALITGYITRSLGITIHLVNCDEIATESSRLVSCAWY